jgi:hypothetical protein
MKKTALFLCLLLAFSTAAFAGSTPSDKELAALRNEIFGPAPTETPQPSPTLMTGCSVATTCLTAGPIIRCTSPSGHCSWQTHCYVYCEEVGTLYCDNCS